MKTNGKNKNMDAVDFPSFEYSEICSIYLKQNIILLDVVFTVCKGDIEGCYKLVREKGDKVFTLFSN